MCTQQKVCITKRNGTTIKNRHTKRPSSVGKRDHQLDSTTSCHTSGGKHEPPTAHRGRRKRSKNVRSQILHEQQKKCPTLDKRSGLCSNFMSHVHMCSIPVLEQSNWRPTAASENKTHKTNTTTETTRCEWRKNDRIFRSAIPLARVCHPTSFVSYLSHLRS